MQWCLPHGSVLSFMLFNIYTNDKLLPGSTSSFIYAADLSLITQHDNFGAVEIIPTVALRELDEYYR